MLCPIMEPHLHLWILLHSETLLVARMMPIQMSLGQSYAKQKAFRNFGMNLQRKTPRISGNADGLGASVWARFISRSRARARNANRRVLPKPYQESPLSGVAERIPRRAWSIQSWRNPFLPSRTHRLIETAISTHYHPSLQRPSAMGATETEHPVLRLDNHKHQNAAPCFGAVRPTCNEVTLNACRPDFVLLLLMARLSTLPPNHLKCRVFPGDRPLQVPCLRIPGPHTLPLP